MLLDLHKDTEPDQWRLRWPVGQNSSLWGGFCQTFPKSAQESHVARTEFLPWVPPTSGVISRSKGINAQHFLQNGAPQKGHTSSWVPLEMVEALVTAASQLNSSLLPFLLPLIAHGYWSQGHISINFLQTNVHWECFPPENLPKIYMPKLYSVRWKEGRGNKETLLPGFYKCELNWFLIYKEEWKKGRQGGRGKAKETPLLMFDKHTFLFLEKLCSELDSLSLHKLTEVKNNITQRKTTICYSTKKLNILTQTLFVFTSCENPEFHSLTLNK